METDDLLYFHRDGGIVRVSATFNEVQTEASLRSLLESVVHFARSLFGELIERQPSLMTNDVIVRLALLERITEQARCLQR